MNRIFTPYVDWMLVFMGIPTLIMWLFNSHMLWSYRRIFIKVAIIVLLFSLPWDYFALHSRIWGWPKGCCTLPKIYGLPLEEYIFIIFAAFYVSTTTLVVRSIYLHHRLHKTR